MDRRAVSSAVQDEIKQDGFAMARGVFSRSETANLREALGPVTGAGRRSLLAVPKVAETARSGRILDLVRLHLPGAPVPVRAIYFDKSSEANWRVAWHQDLTIAVKSQMAAPGFGPWSIKSGIPHVQPPCELLEQMLAVRLHLDDADESNGALRVLPGSHRFGRLPGSRIKSLREELPEVLCRAEEGDVLLMRPLLLHASGRSTNATHRRVLHVEYASFMLPGSLEWNDAA